MGIRTSLLFRLKRRHKTDLFPPIPRINPLDYCSRYELVAPYSETLYNLCQRRKYSGKLLMMGGDTARNM
jgi:hypothetical protein